MTIVATPDANVVNSGRPASVAGRFGLLRLDALDARAGFIPLADDVIRLGRDSLCEIELQGESVHSEHAVIERIDGECWIRDCGSTHGTYVNDEPIDERRLKPGDRVRLGNQLFKFLAGDRIEAQYRDALYEMVTVDALTGAQKRRYFEDAFARELLRAQRHWRPIALLVFDIDDFRSVHHQLGRPAADECLSAFSRRVRARTRGEDLFARLGGEQFALALAEAPLKQSVRVAQDIRRLVEAEPFLTSRGAVSLTISIGVGFASGQGPINAHEIIQQARENLAKAKAAGRNCVLY